MFYALATRKVRTPGMRFTHVLADIETLNQAAPEELYDVTALSFPAYAFLRDKYVLLDCGASFGEGYGPILVASHPMKREELAGRRVAVPGLRTTAYLALKLLEPRFEPVPMAFDQILDAVRNETVEAGLLIHEGQLLFSQAGLHRVVDLGHWWLEQTGLPLPLGGNAVRRALGMETGRQIARAIRESVGYARSEEHTSELQSLRHLVCRLLLEKKKTTKIVKLPLRDKSSQMPRTRIERVLNTAVIYTVMPICKTATSAQRKILSKHMTCVRLNL